MKNWLIMMVMLAMGTFSFDVTFAGNAKSQSAPAAGAARGASGNAVARPSGATARAVPRVGGASGGQYLPGRFTNRSYAQSRAYGANRGRALTYPAVRNSAARSQLSPKLGNAQRLPGNRRLTSPENSFNQRARRKVQTGPSNAAKFSARSQRNQFKGTALDPETRGHLRNWTGSRNTFAEARWKNQYHCHRPHHKDWWRRHCSVIIFYNWGFWGWYGGWWYPTWGYDPYYSYYEYSEPIYGYDGLTPEQITANVQSALQELGYYDGPIDGVVGELTRAAIAAFQRDNGLGVTSAIDEPTLTALELIGS